VKETQAVDQSVYVIGSMLMFIVSFRLTIGRNAIWRGRWTGNPVIQARDTTQ
jgi:hypothetical protein